MKTQNFPFILRYLLIIVVLAGLLFSLTACGETPDPTRPVFRPEESSAPSSAATDPSQDTTPSENTDPTETTASTEATDPTETTEGIVCEHVASTWIVEKSSTCTTEGIRYTECLLCEQRMEEEVIPMTPHIPGEWIVDNYATCAVEGVQHQDCTQCKATLIYINLSKTNHTTAIIPGYSATTQKPGLTDGKKCTVCMEILVEQQVIPPLGSGTPANPVG